MDDIRRLVPVDVQQLKQLLRECWVDTYKGVLPDHLIQKVINTWQSEEILLSGLENPRAYYAGYMVEGRLAGMVSASKTDQDTLKIYHLYVLPAYQRRGIGRRLMDRAIEHFTEVHKVVLEVEEGNLKGISFYKKYGFDYPSKSRIKVDGDEIPCLVGELRIRQS